MKKEVKENPVRCGYNSRLQKGGALFEDMRLIVRNWQNEREENRQKNIVIENILGKNTRSRALDTLRRAFLPRFVKGRPANAWKIVRTLEDRNVPVDLLRPVYYWITARNEPLLYDFVSTKLIDLGKSNSQRITALDVYPWLKSRLADCGKVWSESVTVKVVRGMLATLRDFGILEGVAKKRIAPVYIPVESFAYIAFVIDREGVTGINLLNHPDWSLFLFSSGMAENMFLEADRNGLLRFQAAGNIVRIEFLARSYEEMADVIVTRTH
ncbi:MAG: DUF1819 family protein [Armatimonadetes bacterium]|nr:DUF1819 family protein [Armatimonadota bacterium]